MKLAILGGEPIRRAKVHQFPNTAIDDLTNVVSCFKNNSFSSFRAGMDDGGEWIRSFEALIRSDTGSNYAVSMDTWSNGLVAALMALGVEAGDEVIVPAYTMSSCATSILACGAVPVFVDVSEDNFCLDPADVYKKRTNKTKAIIVVHLFGIPAPMQELMSPTTIGENGVKILEDCAQAPLAKYKGKVCGTFGDIGGFSLTESKHVMSGEGGVAFTDDPEIAKSLRIVRNHGEVREDNNKGLIGYNFRMTEPTAALAFSQWKKIKNILKLKREMVSHLADAVKDIPYLKPAKIDYEAECSWYQFPLRFLPEVAGISRERYVNSLNAEGMNFSAGYVKPLYKQSIYRENKHWAIKHFGSHVDYNMECPVIERLWSKELIATLDIRPPYTMKDMEDIVRAFNKVHENLEVLRNIK